VTWKKSEVPTSAAGETAAGYVVPKSPTEAELQKEYDRLYAAAAPVEEYHVRHILVHTREDALAALDRLHRGESFAEVAAKMSIDPGSRMRGGDLGWNVPKAFIKEFSKAMASLKPAGLASEPTQTKFGWHVIEVLQTEMGKQSFPKYQDVKDRIAAKLQGDREAAPRVSAAAVCRKMVEPEMPAAATREHVSGSVVAEMRVEGGKVAEVTSLSGPSLFYESVTAAINRYECDKFSRPVTATQTFTFKAE
jgi:hypothetical protein